MELLSHTERVFFVIKCFINYSLYLRTRLNINYSFSSADIYLRNFIQIDADPYTIVSSSNDHTDVSISIARQNLFQRIATNSEICESFNDAMSIF